MSNVCVTLRVIIVTVRASVHLLVGMAWSRSSFHLVGCRGRVVAKIRARECFCISL